MITACIVLFSFLLLCNIINLLKAPCEIFLEPNYSAIGLLVAVIFLFMIYQIFLKTGDYWLAVPGVTMLLVMYADGKRMFVGGKTITLRIPVLTIASIISIANIYIMAIQY